VIESIQKDKKIKHPLFLVATKTDKETNKDFRGMDLISLKYTDLEPKKATLPPPSPPSNFSLDNLTSSNIVFIVLGIIASVGGLIYYLTHKKSTKKNKSPKKHK